MKNSFEFYRTLSPYLIDNLKYYSDKLECFYIDDDKSYSLELADFTTSSRGFSALVEDPRCVWNSAEYNLVFKRKYKIENKDILFSKGSIADQDDVLGLAVQWYSPDSNERGVRSVGLIKNDSSVFDMELNLEMRPGFFKGDIRLDTVIYLYKKGNRRTEYTATQSGTILGILEEATISLDGTGSVFPIVVVEDKTKPLWWVDYSNNLDPTVDRFIDENVSIVINQAHPNYPLLNMEKSVADSPMFSEILAAALIIIIERVKSDASALGVWNDVMSNDGLQPGSIGSAIFFFYNTLEWHIDDVVLLSNDIRSYLINNLGGVAK